MHLLSRLLQPLRRVASAFFQHDVSLRRIEDGGVRIVLEQRGVRRADAPPSRAEIARRKEAAELALMRQQLADLLDTLPETRRAMRHLVFVEQALAQRGLKALHKLPLQALQHALQQLEGLVTNWSPEGLANLRSKMAVAITDREHMDPDAEADAYRTAAVLDHAEQAPGEPPAAPAAAGDDDADDADALAAAYAALGGAAPLAAEVLGELRSPAGQAAAREMARANAAASDEIRLRELA